MSTSIWIGALAFWVAMGIGLAIAMYRQRDAARVLRCYPARVRYLLPGWRDRMERGHQERVAQFVRLVLLWRLLLLMLLVMLALFVIVSLVELGGIVTEEPRMTMPAARP